MRSAALLPTLLATLLAAREAPPALTWGAELRLRSESWNQLLDHWEGTEDARIQYRLRSRLWGAWRASESLALRAGLVQENRHIVRPDVAIHAREVVFEALAVDWRFHSKGRLSFGRQDVQRGEGFVLFDGTPLDGSRTSYSNALVAAWEAPAATVELIGISNPRKDQYLPRLGEARRPSEVQQLGEWDLRAVGLYATGRPWGPVRLEGYGLHLAATGDGRATSHPFYRADRRVVIAGARVQWEPAPRRMFTAEATAQRGEEDAVPGLRPQRDLRAWGGYARFSQTFERAWAPFFAAGVTALSGDDPSTTACEGWEPFLSRWPKWSEALVLSEIPETAVATATNLALAEAEVRVKPRPWLELKAFWLGLRALEAPTPGGLYGDGRRRGQIWGARANLDLGHGFRAHGLLEHFEPGTFYARRDGGYYLRFEVAWRR